jgi:hypothetical protein
MDRKLYYKRLFFIGAIWNWVAGLLFFFWSDPIYSFFNMKAINYPGVMQLAMALVFVFGIGYYWVSKDISMNHDIVKLGIIAKTLVFLVFSYHTLIGNMPPQLGLSGVVDLIFAVLFLEFLMKMRKVQVSS